MSDVTVPAGRAEPVRTPERIWLTAQQTAEPTDRGVVSDEWYPSAIWLERRHLATDVEYVRADLVRAATVPATEWVGSDIQTVVVCFMAGTKQTSASLNSPAACEAVASALNCVGIPRTPLAASREAPERVWVVVAAAHTGYPGMPLVVRPRERQHADDVEYVRATVLDDVLAVHNVGTVADLNAYIGRLEALAQRADLVRAATPGSPEGLSRRIAEAVGCASRLATEAAILRDDLDRLHRAGLRASTSAVRAATTPGELAVNARREVEDDYAAAVHDLDHPAESRRLFGEKLDRLVVALAELPAPRDGTAEARLAEAARIIEAADARCLAHDGPVGRIQEEMTDAEWRKLYLLVSGEKTDDE